MSWVRGSGRIRIAFVTETFLPKVDGIVTRLTHAIGWLRQEGHEVLVISPAQGDRPDTFSYQGARVVGLPSRPFLLYPDLKVSWPGPKVGRLLDEFRPGVVHVVNPAILGIAGIYYGWRGPWPLVASYHTQIPQYADYYHLPVLKPLIWQWLKTLHNRADMNLCTSRAVQEELKQHRFRNVHVWRRGVDLDQFTPKARSQSMRERLTAGHPGKTLVLYVGRLAAEKQIEKVKHVLEASDDVCLAIVGDGPHRQALKKHFAGTRTVFTGFLHGDELAAAYASSDVFVFPSTSETLGLVILEAMASGLPVIAARSGPSREQIEDGETGALYEPGDPQSFVRAVLTFRDQAERERMSAAAQQASRDFGWDASSAQLAGFYEQVVAGTSTTAGASQPEAMR